jgi:hypothetical protein
LNTDLGSRDDFVRHGISIRIQKEDKKETMVKGTGREGGKEDCSVIGIVDTHEKHYYKALTLP